MNNKSVMVQKSNFSSKDENWLQPGSLIRFFFLWPTIHLIFAWTGVFFWICQVATQSASGPIWKVKPYQCEMKEPFQQRVRRTTLMSETLGLQGKCSNWYAYFLTKNNSEITLGNNSVWIHKDAFTWENVMQGGNPCYTGLPTSLFSCWKQLQSTFCKKTELWAGLYASNNGPKSIWRTKLKFLFGTEMTTLN